MTKQVKLFFVILAITLSITTAAHIDNIKKRRDLDILQEVNQDQDLFEPEQIFNQNVISVVTNTDADQAVINPPECGKRSVEQSPSEKNLNAYNVSFRIAGGVPAKEGDWGWQVSINHQDRFICGGSLINRHWVVTAANCILGSNLVFYEIILGMHNRKAPEAWSVRRKVKRIIKHPGYSENGRLNDIALIRLDKPVDFKREITPVCLPDGSVLYQGEDGYATGWGSVEVGGSLSPTLQEVKIKLFEDIRCIQKFGSSVYTPIQICAGDTGETDEKKDICEGDFGGPLVTKHKKKDDTLKGDQFNDRWYLAGISSFGRNCNECSVFTRTSHYYNWINQELKQNIM